MQRQGPLGHPAPFMAQGQLATQSGGMFKIRRVNSGPAREVGRVEAEYLKVRLNRSKSLLKQKYNFTKIN